MVTIPTNPITPKVKTHNQKTSTECIIVMSLVPFFLVVMNISVFVISLPEEGPRDYCRTQTTMDCSPRIDVFGGHLTSEKTRREIDYDQLGMCLGQGIQKKSFHLLNYVIDFSRDEDCKVLCSRTFKVRSSDWINRTNELSNENSKDARQLYTLAEAIKKGHQQNMIVDNFPVTWCYAVTKGHGKESMSCKKEFPIGCYVGKDDSSCIHDSRFSKPNTYYLFNHLKFLITYNRQESKVQTDDLGDGRITSVKVILTSIDHNVVGDYGGSCGHTPMAIDGSLSKIRSLNITYSYSVAFIKDDSISWRHRWDSIKSIPGRPSKFETYGKSDIFFPALVTILITVMYMFLIWITFINYDTFEMRKRFDAIKKRLVWKT